MVVDQTGKEPTNNNNDNMDVEEQNDGGKEESMETTTPTEVAAAMGATDEQQQKGQQESAVISELAASAVRNQMRVSPDTDRDMIVKGIVHWYNFFVRTGLPLEEKGFLGIFPRVPKILSVPQRHHDAVITRANDILLLFFFFLLPGTTGRVALEKNRLHPIVVLLLLPMDDIMSTKTATTRGARLSWDDHNDKDNNNDNI